MSIVERMARAIQTADRATDIAGECPQEGAATSMAEDVSDWSAFLSRAALRAIKPEDVSEKMRTALRWELDNTLNLHGYEDDEIDELLARAIAAAIAAGAEQ